MDRKKKDKIITIITFILLVLIIGLLVYKFVTSKDKRKLAAKDYNITTVTTTTINPTAQTNTQEITTSIVTRTIETTPSKQQGVNYQYQAPDNTPKPGEYSFIYNYTVIDDSSYKLYVCNQSNNSRVSSFTLYKGNDIVDKSNDSYGLNITKEQLSLSNNPVITIGVGNTNKYQATYSISCK